MNGQPNETYKYVRAVVDVDGELRIEYQLEGGPSRRDGHDEAVADWTDDQIRRLVADLIDCEPEEVEVQHV